MAAINIPLPRAIQEVAVEELSAGVRETLPAESPLFARIYNSWEGVIRNNIGREAINAEGTVNASQWVYRWIWNTAIGGRFKFVNPQPELFTRPSDNNKSNVMRLKENKGFPSAAEVVYGRYANPYVALAEGRGIIALPFQLRRAQKLTSVLVDILAAEFQASATLLARSEAVSMFSRNPTLTEAMRSGVASSSDDPLAVGQMLDGTSSAAHIKLAGTKAVYGYDRISVLKPGMTVSVYDVVYDYDASGNTIKIKDLSTNGSTVCGFIVDQVDYIDQAVCLVTADGRDAAAKQSLSTNDRRVVIIVLEGSGVLAGASGETISGVSDMHGLSEDAFMDALDSYILDTSANTSLVRWGPDGLESWIKSAYTNSLYGISLAKMPQLKSMVVSLTTADYLTEHRLNDWVSWFRDQYGQRFMFDHLIMSNGVMNGFVRNMTPTGQTAVAASSIRQIYDRTGKGMGTVRGGWRDIQYGYRDMDFTIIDDPMVKRKTVYGVRVADNNFRRLMPPPLPGAKGQPKFQDAEFVTELGGVTGPFKWANPTSGGGTPDLLEALYIVTYQHFMELPVCFKAKNISESTGKTTT